MTDFAISSDAGDYDPVIVDGAVPGGAVEIRRRPPSGDDGHRWRTVWRFEADDAGAARQLFDWIQARPERWAFWGLLATTFDKDIVVSLVAEEAGRDAREAAAKAALEREQEQTQEQENLRLSRQIDLYIHDKRGHRPGLSLESANDTLPFWKMNFSERWERERVLDWMHRQKGSFAEWREHLESHGKESLDRLLMAGMRETERDVKARGLAARGQRPLRFWKGE